MKVVILAGGFGTRISEESHLKPKPMIEIGGKPILWHIMKYYSEFGFHDFIICLGYKQYVVKEFFADYFLHTSDVTFDLANNRMEVHNNYAEPWKVTLVDTGLNTMTGGRVKRIRPYTPRHKVKMERSHREDQKRFYSCHCFYSLDDLAKQLAVHNRLSNNFPMRPLAWRSPREFTVQYV